MIIAVSSLAFLYIILIISLSFGFKKVTYFKENSKEVTTKFSVIIPFRNEAECLPKLLTSILKLNYPKDLVEFIFVNDASTDNSLSILKNVVKNNTVNIKILNNNRVSNSPKKDAIITAITTAKNNWIVTTDADCILPVSWLKTLGNFIHKKTPIMVIAPVNYRANNSFLEQFQLLDFMSMQGTTIGGFGINFPFLCNGANLAYKKDIFLQVNGFDGNTNIASGDDIFLFEKFKDYDVKRVHYLKSKQAIVTTFPVKSWSNLIEQRKRWAAKTANFKSVKVKCIGLLLMLTNLTLLVLLCSGNIKIFAVFFILKILVDWLLFKPTLQFFGHNIGILNNYIPASFVYPFFGLYVFLTSVITKYNWKGRQFTK